MPQQPAHTETADSSPQVLNVSFAKAVQYLAKIGLLDLILNESDEAARQLGLEEGEDSQLELSPARSDRATEQ